MHYSTNNQSYKLKEWDMENAHTLNQLVSSLILCIQIYAPNQKVIIAEVVHYNSSIRKHAY